MSQALLLSLYTCALTSSSQLWERYHMIPNFQIRALVPGGQEADPGGPPESSLCSSGRLFSVLTTSFVLAHSRTAQPSHSTNGNRHAVAKWLATWFTGKQAELGRAPGGEEGTGSGKWQTAPHGQPGRSARPLSTWWPSHPPAEMSVPSTWGLQATYHQGLDKLELLVPEKWRLMYSSQQVLEEYFSGLQLVKESRCVLDWLTWPDLQKNST